MADTRKKRKRKGRQRNSAKAPKRLARQRLSRSKRRRFTHRVAPPKALAPPAKAIVTAKPPGPLPERMAPAKTIKAEKPADDALAPAKAAVAAKAVHKTPLKSQEEPDGVKKAITKPTNVRDARPHEKPQQSDRPSGSQYQKAPPKGKGPQGKK